jgi:hypothetical protein
MSQRKEVVLAKDVELPTDAYRFIPNPAENNGSMVLVPGDYEDQIDQELLLALLELKQQYTDGKIISHRLHVAHLEIRRKLAKTSSSSKATTNGVKYSLTNEQQEAYNSIKANCTMLSTCKLNNEDSYQLSRIKRELNNTLELHETAVKIGSIKYDANKLDNLLAQFSKEIQHLADKQTEHINNQLELQEILNTTR